MGSRESGRQERLRLQVSKSGQEDGGGTVHKHVLDNNLWRKTRKLQHLTCNSAGQEHYENDLKPSVSPVTSVVNLLSSPFSTAAELVTTAHGLPPRFDSSASRSPDN